VRGLLVTFTYATEVLHQAEAHEAYPTKPAALDGSPLLLEGETAWKFVPEVCLLADAQIELTARVLSSLVVKPENMIRNLDRASGFICSESLLMRLSDSMGRDQAHTLVKEICDAAREQGKSLREIAAGEPAVRRHLTAASIDSSLAPESYLGETQEIVSRVVSSYRKRRKARKLP